MKHTIPLIIGIPVGIFFVIGGVVLAGIGLGLAFGEGSYTTKTA